MSPRTRAERRLSGFLTSIWCNQRPSHFRNTFLYRAYPRIRIPFYYAFKLAFLVYLGYPGWNGATLIYNNFLKGVLQKYESTVDAHLDAAKASAAAAVANASQSSGETDIKKKN